MPGQELRRALPGHAGTVNAVAIAPDGTWLATASGNGARIWDTATGGAQAVLTGHRKRVHAWDVITGRVQVSLMGHRGLMHAVAIAPDGSWLATAGDDGTVR